jgi:hypothetical protein
MNTRLSELLERWAKHFPESCKRFDYEQFYDVIQYSYSIDFRLGCSPIEDALSAAGKYNKELCEHYCTIYENVFSFLEHIQYQKQLETHL